MRVTGRKHLAWRMPLVACLVLAPALAMTAFASAGSNPSPTLPETLEAHTVASGLNAPVGAVWAPDGRLFIAEKQGTVKVVLPGESPTARVLFDISGHVATHVDRGLLGIATDSDFVHNGYLYLLYTYDPDQTRTESPKTARLTRVKVGAGATLAAGETVILGSKGSKACPTPGVKDDCMPSDGSSHSIGTVRSDPDGSLWVGIGDGVTPGSLSSTIMRALDPNVLSGAIIHIDRAGKGLRNHPFCPTVTDLTRSCTKVFAKGLRNPFRFTLLGNGRIAIGDVGYDSTEELDVATGGKSFGWPCREAAHPQAVYANTSACKKVSASSQTDPVYEYAHASGGAAIMAGPVLGSTWGPFAGRLVVGDYARGTAGLFDLSNPTAGVDPLVTGLQSVVDMEPAPGGGIAMVEAGFTAHGVDPGRVWVLEPAGANQRPWAKPTVVTSGSTGTFDANAIDADSTDLTYAWDFGDGISGTGEQPSHTYATPGVYYARVTVSDGTETGTDVVPVAAGMTAPVVTITSPAEGAQSSGGQLLRFSGGATLDGLALPASATSWTLILHHGVHDHFLTSFTGRVGSVTLPTDHDADSSYDLILRATTSQGRSAYKRVSIHPLTQSLTLSTSIAGQTVGWAGKAVLGTKATAVGMKAGLSVPTTKMVGSARWRFRSWSDGSKAAVRTFTMPNRAATLKATYTRG
ncbi:MAG: PQQ-dependent sugar dehydrogenase [Solirubrobacterales bacterium]|nr:PQQ-dependent sugar dehydrogenase [Solirubrobacterales bacterium]